MYQQHTRHLRSRQRLQLAFLIGGAILAVLLTAGMLYYWNMVSHLR